MQSEEQVKALREELGEMLAVKEADIKNYLKQISDLQQQLKVSPFII